MDRLLPGEKPRFLIAAGFSTHWRLDRDILIGLCRLAREREGWRILRLETNSAISPTQIRELGIGGIVTKVVDSAHYKRLRRCGVPIVDCSTRCIEAGLEKVVADEVEVGASAARYFIGRGFTKLAFFGCTDHNGALLRQKGFLAVARQQGIQVQVLSSSLAVQERPWSISYITSLHRQLAKLPLETGLFGWNDHICLRILDVCRFHGIAVPTQLCVLGVHADTLGQETSHVSLSSVTVPYAQIGYEAGLRLHALAQGQPSASVQVCFPPTGIDERESTNHCAVPDADLARGLSLIGRLAHERLSVVEFARATGLSRRVLEQRVKKYLHSTPLKEIHLARIERVKQLAANRRFKMAEIAQMTGFLDGAQLSTIFRRYVGMSPSEFRRRTYFQS